MSKVKNIILDFENFEKEDGSIEHVEVVWNDDLDFNVNAYQHLYLSDDTLTIWITKSNLNGYC